VPRIELNFIDFKWTEFSTIARVKSRYGTDIDVLDWFRCVSTVRDR